MVAALATTASASWRDGAQVGLCPLKVAIDPVSDICLSNAGHEAPHPPAPFVANKLVLRVADGWHYLITTYHMGRYKSVCKQAPVCYALDIA